MEELRQDHIETHTKIKLLSQIGEPHHLDSA
jgi:hypothetical protein